MNTIPSDLEERISRAISETSKYLEERISREIAEAGRYLEGRISREIAEASKLVNEAEAEAWKRRVSWLAKERVYLTLAYRARAILDTHAIAAINAVGRRSRDRGE